MLNTPARAFLMSTSFAPVLFVVAINVFDCKTLWFWGLCFLGALLIVVCWKRMKNLSKKPVTRRERTYHWHIEEFSSKDEGIHTFLILYILPIVRSPDSLLNADMQTILSAIGMIILIIIIMVKMGAFNFNPVMSILGYKFYGVKDRDGEHHLLIARKPLVRHGTEVRTRRISQHVFVRVEDGNAETEKFSSCGNCRSKKSVTPP